MSKATQPGLAPWTPITWLRLGAVTAVAFAASTLLFTGVFLVGAATLIVGLSQGFARTARDPRAPLPTILKVGIAIALGPAIYVLIGLGLG